MTAADLGSCLNFTQHTGTPEQARPARSDLDFQMTWISKSLKVGATQYVIILEALLFTLGIGLFRQKSVTLSLAYKKKDNVKNI